MVNINLKNLKDALTVKVFDINSSSIYTEQILQSKLIKFEFNAPTGIYFIELSTEGRKNIYKLIKK